MNDSVSATAVLTSEPPTTVIESSDGECNSELQIISVLTVID